MVGVEQLCLISSRLNVIMGITKGGVMFGGIPIFAFGDLYQLPPICARKLWENPSPSAQSSVIAKHPWKDCFLMDELNVSPILILSPIIHLCTT